jgi:hypothetical protein
MRIDPEQEKSVVFNEERVPRAELKLAWLVLFCNIIWPVMHWGAFIGPLLWFACCLIMLWALAGWKNPLLWLHDVWERNVVGYHLVYVLDGAGQVTRAQPMYNRLMQYTLSDPMQIKIVIVLGGWFSGSHLVGKTDKLILARRHASYECGWKLRISDKTGSYLICSVPRALQLAHAYPISDFETWSSVIESIIQTLERKRGEAKRLEGQVAELRGILSEHGIATSGQFESEEVIHGG